MSAPTNSGAKVPPTLRRTAAANRQHETPSRETLPGILQDPARYLPPKNRQALSEAADRRNPRPGPGSIGRPSNTSASRTGTVSGSQEAVRGGRATRHPGKHHRNSRQNVQQKAQQPDSRNSAIHLSQHQADTQEHNSHLDGFSDSLANAPRAGKPVPRSHQDNIDGYAPSWSQASSNPIARVVDRPALRNSIEPGVVNGTGDENDDKDETKDKEGPVAPVQADEVAKRLQAAHEANSKIIAQAAQGTGFAVLEMDLEKACNLAFKSGDARILEQMVFDLGAKIAANDDRHWAELESMLEY
ncbi:hypothetical protein SUNI508_02903 [Seiridium unicorne]|uniref:Uncharacterized protein n=1 Tax=Seiridium unicorne TaxID=138068 RepID=A0ABR2VHU7_9PEZI